MIQKNCFDCGTPLIEKELEGEGIVPYCRMMPERTSALIVLLKNS